MQLCRNNGILLHDTHEPTLTEQDVIRLSNKPKVERNSSPVELVAILTNTLTK